MITTVTLNPCLDMTVYLDRLAVGELNMVRAARTDVAGKGINVSMVLRALGQSTLCTGINFDGNGQQLENYLEMHSIAHRFVKTRGEIRTNIKLLEESTSQMTEVNHRGFPVEPVILEQCIQQVVACAEESDVVVFSGRIPMGAEDDIYRRCLAAIRHLPVKVVLDAEGEPLRLAIQENPYLIKPNIYELETAFGVKIHSHKDVVEVCRGIINRGVELVCVSMGGEGAAIVSREEAFFAPALNIPIRGLQGAGDSIVAGVCTALHENLPLRDMLRYGVAAASASLLREGTLLCQKADFDRLLGQVEPVAIE